MFVLLPFQVFHTEGDVNPHRSFRQEVTFLAQLHHPSIISMQGVSVRPRAIVLEKAPLGSLSSRLSKGEVMSRSLQHRIALQVWILACMLTFGSRSIFSQGGAWVAYAAYVSSYTAVYS